MKNIKYLAKIALILLFVAMFLFLVFSHIKYYKVQKEATMQQLNKIESIYEVATATRNEQPGSDWGHPNPNEAINIVDNAISELKKLKVDTILVRYRDLSINVLQYIKSHHELRLLEKDPFLFNSKAGEIYLKQIHVEGEREKEYWSIKKGVRVILLIQENKRVRSPHLTNSIRYKE